MIRSFVSITIPRFPVVSAEAEYLLLNGWTLQRKSALKISAIMLTQQKQPDIISGHCDGGLAQLGERLSYKQRVSG
ncbi:hypothetical protein, partial [Faecalibaculum rodentium]|uniref:hypothetical protein n=1 Tax=Faecalibaculum rodentium TaxID=1702221 RepID=UPI0023F26486